MVSAAVSVGLLLVVSVLACCVVAAGLGVPLSSLDSSQNIDVAAVLMEAQTCENGTLPHYNISAGNVTCIKVGEL